MENAGFSSFIVFYCNLLMIRFYIKPLFTVAAGRSVCEHFRHIQVSPTYKLQATNIYHTHLFLYIYGFFGGLFKNAVNECHKTIKHSLKDSDKEAP
jgi:hypothetical protein